jgi:hypothetical protein
MLNRLNRDPTQAIETVVGVGFIIDSRLSCIQVNMVLNDSKLEKQITTKLYLLFCLTVINTILLCLFLKFFQLVFF